MSDKLRVLLLDFYDSFTYNLAHYLESYGVEVIVCKNDELNMANLPEFDALVFSPGPGLPAEKKNFFELLDIFIGKKKILGVCLGMQGIAQYLGAELYNLNHVKHGIIEEINVISNAELFRNCPKRISVGLYHSWAVRNLQNTGLKITASTDESIIMAFEDIDKALYGVQFHPESILSEYGKDILKNFLGL